MSGRPPVGGFQFSLLEENDNRAAAWHAARVLGEELRVFCEREEEENGLSEPSAGVLARHLGSMVRVSGAGTVAAFLSDPSLVFRTVRAIEREPTRRARYQAAADFAELLRDTLPAGTAEALEREFDRLPGRVSPASNFVDRSFGGSTKQTRIRMPLSWEDGERLITAAIANAGDSGSADRDAALVALHVRSGLRPELIRVLAWDEASALLGASAEVVLLPLREAVAARVVHISAIELLRTLHRSEGEPVAGSVFLSVRRPRKILSDKSVADVVSSAALRVGFPSIDRRHLAAPFGVWLRARGWSDLALRDALGYSRVATLREALRPVEEMNAQIRTREVLVLPTGRREAPCNPVAGAYLPAMTRT